MTEIKPASDEYLRGLKAEAEQTIRATQSAEGIGNRWSDDLLLAAPLVLSIIARLELTEAKLAAAEKRFGDACKILWALKSDDFIPQWVRMDIESAVTISYPEIAEAYTALAAPGAGGQASGEPETKP